MESNLTIGEIKRIASEIAQRHGVERMFLFGSYARGDAKPGSDLDFRRRCASMDETKRNLSIPDVWDTITNWRVRTS